jgi:hypothetical protein
MLIGTLIYTWKNSEKPAAVYRDFVANLRAADCPESTVEDIVRGNVERAFYAKRVELNLVQTTLGGEAECKANKNKLSSIK